MFIIGVVYLDLSKENINIKIKNTELQYHITKNIKKNRRKNREKFIIIVIG